MDPTEFNEGSHKPLGTWQATSILIPLGGLTLWIVLSNAFVILSVLSFKSMRTPPNMYLASLASTDLLVGVLILPLNILQIVNNHWILSQELCKTWLTLDVTLSTLSILHLIAIAVDRYRAISDGLSYVQNRSTKEVFSVIACLWIICIWISTPPVLGWGNWNDIDASMCEYSTTLGYVWHSAFGSFIFPMILMITIYWKIYRKIQERLKARAAKAVPSMENSLDRELSETTEPSGDLFSKRGKRNELVSRCKNLRPSSQIHDFVSKKIRFSLTKERRAAQTLGVIIGCFMICWVPFCTMYLLRPITGDPPLFIYNLLTWMGYFNSAVNPVIYCIYSKEFKRALRRILCCWKTNRTNVNIV